MPSILPFSPRTLIRAFFRSLVLAVALLGGLCTVGGCDWGQETAPRIEGDDSITVNSIGMRFRRIPAGTFQMGSPNGPPDEQPVHEVQISEPLDVGIHEVTQLQWNRLMDQNPSHFEGRHRPVENVSWREVRVFIRRLNEKEDTDVYRLPTEAEWEYAVRGGSNMEYHFGEEADALTEYAWYSMNSERRTHRGGRKKGNPFGLHDMYGNVWEWVHDRYGSTFYEESGRVDPVNEGGLRARRVIRGGGWFAVDSDLRSGSRGWAQPGSKDPKLGFRIVREPSSDE